MAPNSVAGVSAIALIFRRCWFSGDASSQPIFLRREWGVEQVEPGGLGHTVPINHAQNLVRFDLEGDVFQRPKTLGSGTTDYGTTGRQTILRS
jgi:hypothetical protein